MTADVQKPSTREAILDATDRLMARYGFRKMTLEDVAREAGISKRTIYLQFRSKEDVGLSSIGRVVGRVIDELERIAESSAPRQVRLRRLLERRVMGRIEQVQDYAHSLDELFEVVRPAYLARRAVVFAQETAILAGVLAEPGPAKDHHRRIAEALLLATNAFLPYSLSPRELGSPESIAERLDSMIDTLLCGAIELSRDDQP
ncbi:MAG TPA: TetR/AcrR family transcriptional regulator [Fimbriimonadaceae bacterium]|nr:TetR/AcrR family transcriptional regulator [Fimbriimonadaceae bacterium]HRJ95633.1 TetR/AcrR family transcriptional regulator [Fimbriimonadaceae bacterium]